MLVLDEIMIKVSQSIDRIEMFVPLKIHSNFYIFLIDG